MSEEVIEKESSSSKSQKYSDEKKFLKDEENKNTSFFKSKLKNKFLINVVICCVLTVLVMFATIFIMLDKIKEYDRKFAMQTQIVYNMSQTMIRTTQKDSAIQEICRVALFYNPKYDEARLYKVAEAIYDIGFIKYGLSIDECILLISVESEWVRRATSPAGAKGLMQLMIPTARWACASIGISYEGDDTLFNDILNVKMGLYVYNQYKYYFDDNLVNTLAAYNWGETQIRYEISGGKKLSGKYLRYYNLWKEKRNTIEKLLNRKLNVKEE